MEKKICYMFRDVPAKLFKLKNTDFFSPEQGLYPTMGVDRVAALYGAKLHYGSPALVIDGGTAMTYSALDGNGHIIGGGISPGVKVRLQSLADYTGSLPDIDHRKFKSLVEGAIAAKTPLPFFAKDTEMAMISPVCAELACQLRNIIKQFVSRFQSSSELKTAASGKATAEKSPKQKIFTVIVTGGDGKFLHDLLKADASGIISVEPDASPAPTNIDVKNVKNLVTYALGYLINEKYSQKPMNPEEKLRQTIQGLRIAAPAIDQNEVFSRGCVFNITPNATIEGYIFHARFDSSIQKDLTLKELYEYLALYNEIGEKAKSPGSVEGVDEDWVTEKKMWSSKVQEELGNVSRPIRIRIRELKPYIERGEVHKIFQRRSRKRPPSKKAKKNVENFKNHIGKRIAKTFPIDDGNSGENAGYQIFFGTVESLSDTQLLWFYVRYDDGDAEESGVEEVLKGIKLYEQHKHNDTMLEQKGMELEQSDDVAESQVKTSLPIGRKPNAVFLHTETEEGVEYTDLSTLLSNNFYSSVDRKENMRQISECKEDI